MCPLYLQGMFDGIMVHYQYVPMTLELKIPQFLSKKCNKSLGYGLGKINIPICSQQKQFIRKYAVASQGSCGAMMALRPEISICICILHHCHER